VIQLGYKLMAEEHEPRALVANGRRAEEAGFAFAAISDHFFPWLEVQGHSPFAWSVLGALAQATRRIGLMTAVTCPSFRYHPAIVAQAAATVALLADGRFTLGLGSGERLNEHVIGAGWPDVSVRQEQLREALEIIGLLFEGGTHSYRGAWYALEDARLYDLPEPAPPIALAAGGPRAARLAAECANGLITTEPRRELVDAFAEAGGEGPRYAEVSLCWAPREEQAREVAHRYARWSGLGWNVLPELPDPPAFEAASRSVRPEDLDESVALGPDVERHVERIRPYVEAGFDHLVLVQIGPEQQGFFDFFERELGPALASAFDVAAREPEPKPERGARAREDAVDEASEESMVASDPPAHSGVRLGPARVRRDRSGRARDERR
jgi:G6PDH family F420-dependent oxidoreductase